MEDRKPQIASLYAGQIGRKSSVIKIIGNMYRLCNHFIGRSHASQFHYSTVKALAGQKVSEICLVL